MAELAASIIALGVLKYPRYFALANPRSGQRLRPSRVRSPARSGARLPQGDQEPP